MTTTEKKWAALLAATRAQIAQAATKAAAREASQPAWRTA